MSRQVTDQETELERDSAAMTVTANAEVAAGLAIAAERDALRARVDALYGVTLFAHAFAEAEPLVSGYVRLHGHILHLRGGAERRLRSGAGP